MIPRILSFVRQAHVADPPRACEHCAQTTPGTPARRRSEGAPPRAVPDRVRVLDRASILDRTGPSTRTSLVDRTAVSERRSVADGRSFLYRSRVLPRGPRVRRVPAVRVAPDRVRSHDLVAPDPLATTGDASRVRVARDRVGTSAASRPLSIERTPIAAA
ncbi:MAG: hypothetical protein FJW96_04755 [Actinobacteria bacterium]|nr:hypothetical protein [Actinomycetota bacterium]